MHFFYIPFSFFRAQQDIPARDNAARSADFFPVFRCFNNIASAEVMLLKQARWTNVFRVAPAVALRHSRRSASAMLIVAPAAPKRSIKTKKIVPRPLSLVTLPQHLRHSPNGVRQNKKLVFRPINRGQNRRFFKKRKCRNLQDRSLRQVTELFGRNTSQPMSTGSLLAPQSPALLLKTPAQGVAHFGQAPR